MAYLGVLGRAVNEDWRWTSSVHAKAVGVNITPTLDLKVKLRAKGYSVIERARKQDLQHSMSVSTMRKSKNRNVACSNAQETHEFH